MPILRNRIVKIVALLSVMMHAYAFVGHSAGMMQRSALVQAAGTSSSAETAVLAQITAATVMCRPSSMPDPSSSQAGQSTDQTATNESATNEPGSTNDKFGASCPICSGAAVAHPLPPPSTVLLDRLAVVTEVEPTADIASAHLTRDSLPPPRGPPANV